MSTLVFILKDAAPNSRDVFDEAKMLVYKSGRNYYRSRTRLHKGEKEYEIEIDGYCQAALKKELLKMGFIMYKYDKNGDLQAL